MQSHHGDIAQLARVRDWQSRGQGFDSPYLHVKAKTINLRQEVFCFQRGSIGACSGESHGGNKIYRAAIDCFFETDRAAIDCFYFQY